MKYFAKLILCCTAFFNLGWASPPNIDEIVHSTLQRFNVPGAAVGVVVDNKVVLARGYGLRNLEKRLPVTENTLFSIGSSTKSFTAHLLSQLVDEGLIAWDDPVIHYLPEFKLADPILTQQVTIRDLVAHRTGVTRHDELWFISTISKANLLPLTQHLMPTHGLREQFLYNNILFSVTGLIIEKVTGQPWEKAIQTRIFQPLGMNYSLCDVEQLSQSSDFSLPYAELYGVVTQLPFHRFNAISPAGSIISNISDMMKWIQLQLQHAHKQTVQMPLTAAWKMHPDVYYLSGNGLGWLIGNYRGHAWLSHGGRIDGFIAEMTLLPEDNIGVVILTNSSSDGMECADCIRNTLFDQLLDLGPIDWLSHAQEQYDKGKQALREALKERPKTSPTRPWNEYVGIYEHPAHGLIQIANEDQHLVATTGRYHFPLTHHHRDDFQGHMDQFLLAFGFNPIVDFTFVSDTSGAITELHVPFEGFRGMKPVVFKKRGDLSDLRIQEVLTFWFGPLANSETYPEGKMGLWFGKNAAVDEEIRKRFEGLVQAAANNELDAWKSTPSGRLALIILLDQLPRNMYRNQPQAFAYDAKAQQLTLEGLSLYEDKRLYPIERVFFYLPLEHAENLALQEMSVAKFQELGPKYQSFLDYAVQHYEVIKKFGRFPHRNAILGRESTTEERDSHVAF